MAGYLPDRPRIYKFVIKNKEAHSHMSHQRLTESYEVSSHYYPRFKDKFVGSYDHVSPSVSYHTFVTGASCPFPTILGWIDPS